MQFELKWLTYFEKIRVELITVNFSQREKRLNNNAFLQQKTLPSDINGETTTQGLNCVLFNFPDGSKQKSLFLLQVWNKCKANKNKNNVFQFYTKNGIIRIKLVEHGGTIKTVTHIRGLEELLPEIGDL